MKINSLLAIIFLTIFSNYAQDKIILRFPFGFKSNMTIKEVKLLADNKYKFSTVDTVEGYADIAYLEIVPYEDKYFGSCKIDNILLTFFKDKLVKLSIYGEYAESNCFPIVLKNFVSNTYKAELVYNKGGEVAFRNNNIEIYLTFSSCIIYTDLNIENKMKEYELNIDKQKRELNEKKSKKNL